MPAPETVTEAVQFLASEGYVEELQLCAEGLTTAHRDDAHPVTDAVVDHTFRFEGPTDPGDEAIVLGVRCPSWDLKGVLISAYGPDADRRQGELLRRLAGHG